MGIHAARIGKCIDAVETGRTGVYADNAFDAWTDDLYDHMTPPIYVCHCQPGLAFFRACGYGIEPRQDDPLVLIFPRVHADWKQNCVLKRNVHAKYVIGRGEKNSIPNPSSSTACRTLII